MSFKINDRVIAKYNVYCKLGCKNILKGEIFTVKEVIPDGYNLNTHKPGIGVLFKEITNPRDHRGFEIGYDSIHFEKLVSDAELLEYRFSTSEKELNADSIPVDIVKF